MIKNTLKDIFFDLKKHDYVIIKYYDFSEIKRGSDIDIFVINEDYFLDSFLESLKNKIIVNEDLNVQLYKVSEYQTQIDLFDRNGLIIKFDLYFSFPPYINTRIHPNLFYAMIYKCQKIKSKHNGIEFEINVLNDIDEMIIRYIEFNEFYSILPNKIRHIEFIESRNEKIMHDFLHKIHQYSIVPNFNKQKQEKVSIKIKLLEWLIFHLKMIVKILLPKKIIDYLKDLRS